MKIIFDRKDPGDEAHARWLIRKYLEDSNLPRVPGATRAFEPSWCDICGDARAWGSARASAVCDGCRAKDEKRPGF